MFSKKFKDESKGLGTNEVLNLSNILKSNTKCRELNLYGNKIGDKGAIELANVLEVNNTLEKLNLWSKFTTNET